MSWHRIDVWEYRCTRCAAPMSYGDGDTYLWPAPDPADLPAGNGWWFDAADDGFCENCWHWCEGVEGGLEAPGPRHDCAPCQQIDAPPPAQTQQAHP
jgi:hypothetical protein